MLLADGADRPSRETQGSSLSKIRRKEQQDEVQKEAARESQNEGQGRKDRMQKHVRIQRPHTVLSSSKHYDRTENSIGTTPAT